jgi:hypothetical protein
MDTPQTAFSGQPESEKSQSSSETPPPVGPVESAHTNGQTTQSRHPNHETGGAPQGSAPSPGLTREEFQQHLGQLRWAREQADEIMKIYSPAHPTARGTIDQTWQLLFEQLKSLKPSELSEFNTLSSIIHRLCASYTQINGLEIKLCDYEQERVEREKHKLRMLKELKDGKSRGGLSLNTIRELEHTLKLL